MQTRLADAYKDSPLGQEADQVLRSCVHCGFCNATCPTYQLLGDELDGPRGRIYQIKQVLEGDKATTGIQQHLDRCLTCRACETTCPSGVEYHKLLDIGRELVEQQVPRPVLQRSYRRLLQYIFGETRRVALLLFFARLFRPLLPTPLKKRIPVTTRIPLPPARTHARTMLLLDGCVQPAASPQINNSAIQVFDRLAISLRIIPAAGCCGALHHHLSDSNAARQRARANIDAWWPSVQQGAEAIVITASGCAPMVKDYAHLLAGDQQYAQRAARIGAMTRDISEVLRNEDLSRLKTDNAGRIAFHSPCSLQHAQQLDGVVETLLQAVGYSLVPVRDAHLCCGSAGSYSILQPELAKRLRSCKLDALQEKRPELITTANIGCLLHLQQEADVPVRHWIELLASA
ncbi:MAG: glycolate oxidase subunit GlcF [Gammaproteobacteria bacterium]|nr:MAG: glycolate oxidase subunit GlcF [Gammaproteobacteria bacterium]